MTNMTTTRTAIPPAQHSTGGRVAYVLTAWPADTIRRDVLRSFLAAGKVLHTAPMTTARRSVRGAAGGSTHNRGSLRMQNTLAALDKAGAVVREGEEWVRIVDCAELRRRAALLPPTWRDELDRRITRAAEQPPGRRP
jgi:hypothetical protein